MDELEISGKRYISSRRAGRENNYHTDYIGQLIRGGKIHGTKVGRTWYVEEGSLKEYLGADYQGSTSTEVEKRKIVEPQRQVAPQPKPLSYTQQPFILKKDEYGTKTLSVSSVDTKTTNSYGLRYSTQEVAPIIAATVPAVTTQRNEAVPRVTEPARAQSTSTMHNQTTRVWGVLMLLIISALVFVATGYIALHTADTLSVVQGSYQSGIRFER